MCRRIVGGAGAYVGIRIVKCARVIQKINKYCIQFPVNVISITVMCAALYYNMLKYHRYNANSNVTED